MSTCAECVRFDWSNKQTSSVDRRRCVERGIYIEPNASACHYFIKKESAQNTGCYITTVVVSLLKDRDDGWILETLRKFRDNIMQKDYRYANLLLEYDAVGPQIADALMRLHPDDDYCVYICQGFLIPICRLIECEEYTQAVNMYIGMIKHLRNQLGIQSNVEGYSYDANVSNEEKGHGRARVILANE